MSLVETLHRKHLERQVRFLQAALRHRERTAPEPAPVVPQLTACQSSDFDVAKGPFVHDIVKAVCAHLGVPLREIMNDQRNKHLVYPRHITYYLCAKLTLRSLPDIGRRLGDRDHTTILHGARKIERMLKTDIMLQATVEMLTEHLGAHDMTAERTPYAILTSNEVRAIRASRRPVSVIAKEFGVDQSSVYRIRAFLTWKNVT